MSVGIWIRAVRAPFFTAVLVPVAVGVAAASAEAGVFNPGYALLTLVAMVFIQAGANMANDYYDHLSGNDETNQTPTPFSGGSRVIQEGLLPASKVLTASIVCLVIGSAIGLFLYSQKGLTVLLLGIAGIFGCIFYGAPPLKLGYRGLGELIVGLGFGTLVVVGAYFIQAGEIQLEAIFASVPVTVLIGMVLFINEFPDYAADKATRKLTIVVILGKRKSLVLYLASLVFCYVWVLAMVIARIYPVYTLLVLITLPLAYKAATVAIRNYEDIVGLIPSNAATIKLHLSFGLLLAASYGIAALV